jgi:cellulose synthase/poly-beta-1,6-N-acetylglucosamine synthase-like glycosyltransferase
MLLDGYPEKYLSYISRNHRWVRGDWQIVSWLKSKRLNRVSKFKIFDNLRRSLLKVFAFVGVILSFIFSFENFKFSLWLLILSIFSITIMYFLDIVNYIVFKESNIYGAVYSKKKFAREVSGIPLDFLKIFLEVIFLPFEAWENLDAIIRSFYRMTKKKKLLEWTTSEDGEKIAENTLFSNYKKMWINILARNNIFNIFKK